METFQNRYFDWLCAQVCTLEEEGKYSLLLRHLHKRRFTWDNEMDKNRADDGVYLRKVFLQEITENGVQVVVPDYFLESSCTMLEMLIGLAKRVEDVLFDVDFGDRTREWFWQMVSNLGLNTEENTLLNRSYINARIDIFLDKQYQKDGSGGGLFVVKNTRKDLRKAEIWHQMNLWLNSLDL